MMLLKTDRLKVLMLAAVLFFFFPGLSSGEMQDLMNHKDRAEWVCGGFYEGRFADGTPFQMNLGYPTPKSFKSNKEKPSDMDSSYWYPRRFSGGILHLTVKSFKKDRFKLAVQTSDKDGKNATDVEIFEGVVSKDMVNVQGAWTNIKRKKKMAFTMKRVWVYKKVEVDFEEEVDEEDRYDSMQGSFTYSIVFPVIGNSTVDQWIREQAAEYESYNMSINEIRVAWSSKDLLSLYSYANVYGAGAAHPNTYTDYKHFSIAGGACKPVKLDHFVNTSPKCRDKISEKIHASLKKQNFSGAGSASDNLDRFLATPTGIEFDYDPYDAGSYIEGEASVFVVRKDLGKCFKYLPNYE